MSGEGCWSNTFRDSALQVGGVPSVSITSVQTHAEVFPWFLICDNCLETDAHSNLIINPV